LQITPANTKSSQCAFTSRSLVTVVNSSEYTSLIVTVAQPTEGAVSQQFFYWCVYIHFRGNLFNEQLPNNSSGIAHMFTGRYQATYVSSCDSCINPTICLYNESATVTNLYKIEWYGLVDCNAMQFGERQAFRRNISPPSSGSKSNSRKKPAEVGGKHRYCAGNFIGLLFSIHSYSSIPCSYCMSMYFSLLMHHCILLYMTAGIQGNSNHVLSRVYLTWQQ
jgi:hypothetical protein